MWYDFFAEFDAIDWGGVCVVILLLITTVLLILYFTTNTIPIQWLLLFGCLSIVTAGFWYGVYYERKKKRKDRLVQEDPWANIPPDAQYRMERTATTRAWRNLQRKNPNDSFTSLETRRSFGSTPSATPSRTPSQRSSIASTISRRSSENEDFQM